MAQNIPARRGAAIAGSAALVLLVFLAAFDNQWTQHWRDGRSTENGDATHSWISAPIRGLSALAWRATKDSGEPSRIYFGMLAEPIIAVVLTFLLLMLVCRGVGAERGRWSLFLGGWFVTGLAAAIALIAGSVIAGLGIAAGIADDSGSTRFGRGDIYYTLIALGLAFGLFAGWLVGFVAVLVYGSTDGKGTPQQERDTREYSSPAMDYSDYAPASVSSSAGSSGSSGSSGSEDANEDYSFSPTSPYSSSASSSGHGDYSSANAPTQINTPVNTPSQEHDPYGGARPY